MPIHEDNLGTYIKRWSIVTAILMGIIWGAYRLLVGPVPSLETARLFSLDLHLNEWVVSRWYDIIGAPLLCTLILIGISNNSKKDKSPFDVRGLKKIAAGALWGILMILFYNDFSLAFIPFAYVCACVSLLSHSSEEIIVDDHETAIYAVIGQNLILSIRFGLILGIYLFLVQLIILFITAMLFHFIPKLPKRIKSRLSRMKAWLTPA